MKQGRIFAVNMIFFVFFIAALCLMYFIPNSSTRLKRAQDSYAENGESDIDNKWAYFLINEEFPLPDGYEPELSLVQGTFMMDERCARYARDMIAAAKEDGVDLCVVSAYRSIQKQQENLDAYTERLIKEGMSEDEARKAALFEIAEPGTSEHNAGLSLDILT